ncbi:Hypothetical_protein [Hexamita inflata]|uniref:Hypothetical_protein n=1 Tax=Hexamita inflata TaxID=28002 RepID=A0AA86RTL5_9EUKA|nr:Hypothetical protein HINF_LOCUS59950 [Hexamita inflata]CAI9973623.1 Hypothetical protein HINF_LOCUS61268 [Hexamita inflata]
MFIYTDIIQKTALDLQIFNYDVKMFVLFGLGGNQSLFDSQINVSLHLEVFQGALLCVQCNLSSQYCSLVFIASGQQVSGLMIEADKQIYIQQTFIQYRFLSQNASGIVNRISDMNTNITICDSQLTGYNLIGSGYNGYISSLILSNITIIISKLQVCVDNVTSVGNQSIIVTFNGSVSIQCDLCGLSKVIYGICSDFLYHSQELNGIWQCILPFVYVDNKCMCAQGYVIEQNICVNIIQTISSSNQLINQLIMNQTSVDNELRKLEQFISSNTTLLSDQMLKSQSILEDYIKLNISLLQLGQQADISVLDSRILANATILRNDIKSNISAIEQYIVQNNTDLDWRIYKNMSWLNASVIKIENDIIQLTTNITSLNQQVSDNITSISNMINQNMSHFMDLLTSQAVIVNASILDLVSKTIQLENTTQVLKENQYDMKSEIKNLYDLSNQTRADIIANSVQLQQYIIENQSQADRNLLANTTNLDKRIFENVTFLKAEIKSTNDELAECNQNISQFDQMLASSSLIIQQQQLFIQNLNVQIKCLNNGFLYQNDYCVSNYNIACTDNQMSCSQKIFVALFDEQLVSYQVISSSNFSSGYVFDTSSAINNAFINVSDYVYTSVFNPLFQQQNSFTNLMIQFGVQTLNSGSFVLSSSSVVTVNQMNILSKPGSQLIVAADQQLNLLTSLSIRTKIYKMLVNLSFAPSSGNITLISNINGVINITGYQVLGVYNSTQTVAMIGFSIKADANLNHINFKPSAYNVGNRSSYLFSDAGSNKSVLVINNIAVILVNKTNYLLLGSIHSTQINCYVFGGIIAQNNAHVSVNNAIFDSYQHFTTEYVQDSGFLFGQSDRYSNVVISNACIQQNTTSTTLKCSAFGLIGDGPGKITLYNAQITFSVQGAYLWCFGIIGVQSSSQMYAEVINVLASVYLSSSSGSLTGSIVGGVASDNFTIENVTVLKSNIFTNSKQVGGFVGQQLSNLTVVNSTISESNISGFESVGSFIGEIVQQTKANVTISGSKILKAIVFGSNAVGGFVGQCKSTLHLTNSMIQLTRIFSPGFNFGIVVGDNIGTQTINGSSSASNYINNALNNDCPVLSNIWSVAGC